MLFRQEGAPAEDLEVVVGVADALPDALVLGLHSHGEGDDDPGVLEVDGRGAVVGDVAQNEHLDGVVRQACRQQLSCQYPFSAFTLQKV